MHEIDYRIPLISTEPSGKLYANSLDEHNKLIYHSFIHAVMQFTHANFKPNFLSIIMNYITHNIYNALFSSAYIKIIAYKISKAVIKHQ